MTNQRDRASKKPGGPRKNAPGGVTELMERMGCRCAEMAPRMMAGCLGEDEDRGEAGEATATASSETEEDPGP